MNHDDTKPDLTEEDYKRMATTITHSQQNEARIDALERLLLLPPQEPERDYYESGTQEQRAALESALAKAAGDFKPVEKTAHVSFQTNRGPVSYAYAPLANLVAAVKPALSANGIAIRQAFALPVEGKGTIRTILSHQDGGRVVSLVHFTPQSDIKQLGGQTTYLRRYALNCLLMLDGVEDADGHGESTPSGAGRQSAPTPAKPSKSKPKSKPSKSKPSKPEPTEEEAPPLPEPPEEQAPLPEEQAPPEEPPAAVPMRTDQRQAIITHMKRLSLSGAVLESLCKKINASTLASITETGSDNLLEFLTPLTPENALTAINDRLDQ